MQSCIEATIILNGLISSYHCALFEQCCLANEALYERIEVPSQSCRASVNTVPIHYVMIPAKD